MTSKDLKNFALEWVQKQGAAVVLLIGFICYLHYIATTIVPSHISMLNDGYNSRHEKLIEAFEDKHNDDRELILRLMENNGTISPGTAEELRKTR